MALKDSKVSGESHEPSMITKYSKRKQSINSNILLSTLQG
jgi:hypothetical protein